MARARETVLIAVAAMCCTAIALGSLPVGRPIAQGASLRSPRTASGGWHVVLHANGTDLRVGQVVTLTVTASPTAFRGSQAVYIVDLTSRRYMRTCTAALGLNQRSCIAQDQHEAPARHTYQAWVVRNWRRPGNAQILARSGALTVTWSRVQWNVTLHADGTRSETVPLGRSVELVARTNRPLGAEVYLDIRARGCGTTGVCVRGGLLITTCHTGRTCSVSVPSPDLATRETYRAIVNGPVPGGFGRLARSQPVTINWR